MTLVIIWGNRGSGKTTLATAIGLQAKAQGTPVYSNYQIDGVGELKPAMLNSIQGPAVVIIDEAYVWLDSRVSMDVRARFLSYILFQSRKMKLDFILTVQLKHSLDRRYRELCDYYIEAHNEKDKERFRYSIVDVAKMISTDRFLSYGAAEEGIFPHFKTEQRIDNDEARLIESMDPLEQNKRVDEWVSQAELEGIKPTKDSVRNYCFSKGIPQKYSIFIYYRMKERVSPTRFDTINSGEMSSLPHGEADRKKGKKKIRHKQKST